MDGVFDEFFILRKSQTKGLQDVRKPLIKCFQRIIITTINK